MRDYYDILGVDRRANADELKRAYRRAAHRYHPDKNPGDSSAEERFKEATRAYEVLSDPAKRRRYDRFGPAGVGGSGFGGGPGFGQGFGDVFSEIFGDFFGKKAKSPRAQGRDRVYNLKVDFRTAVLGGEQVIDVRRSKRCKHCSGTGAKPGTAPQLCHACGGSGEIRVQQGLFSVSKRCSYCRGFGKIITNPCKACGGRGSIEYGSRLTVKIPAGSDTGTTLRYAGEGEPGSSGGRAGDLRVVLEVEPHSVFRREGNDLHCEVPVTAIEASLGARVDVPTLDGRVRMTIPPGTQTGRVFRLRGKGVPLASGAKGDQHVTVVVETPQQLNDAQRQHLEALREVAGSEHYPLRAAFWKKVHGDA